MRSHSKTISVPLVIVIACAFVVVPAVHSGDIASYYEAREAKLGVRVDELVLEDATLDEAIALLQEKTRANIVITWRDLEMDGFQRTAKSTLRIHDMTLAKALNIVLVAYGDNARPLSTRIANGIIHVEHPSKPQGKQAPTLVYDVADFTTRFITPNDPSQASLSSGNGLFSGAPPAPVAVAHATPHAAGSIVSHMSRQECIDSLLYLIKELVYADSWRDNGGDTGAIHELGGLLIVTQTPEVHLKLQLLLRNLRQLRAAIDRGDPIRPEGLDLLEFSLCEGPIESCWRSLPWSRCIRPSSFLLAEMSMRMRSTGLSCLSKLMSYCWTTPRWNKP
jgi:hypothetical protein